MNKDLLPKAGKAKSPAHSLPARRGRFSLSNLSIKHQLPLLIGLLLSITIVISVWAAYRGVKAAVIGVGRERLLRLTEQLSSLSQQSFANQMGKTSSVANAPAIRAFLRAPSPATRSSAMTILQQFTGPQDPNHLQVELWSADRKLMLAVPEGAAPLQAELATEFTQCATEPFRAAGGIRLLKDTLVAPALAAVRNEGGEVSGYLVRWRKVASTPEARKQLTDLLGNQAALYFGNQQGDLWTDMLKAVPPPPMDLRPTRDIIRYTRDGNPVMALGRPINDTPWFLVVEFPEQVFLSSATAFLRVLGLVGLILFALGLAGAFALSQHIMRPLRALTEAASAISDGDYSRLAGIRRNDELGKLAATFNMMVDQLRDSQRELERKVREQNLLLDAAPSALLGVDEQGHMVLANHQAERLFGYTQDELLEQPVEMLIPERYHAAHSGHRAGFFQQPSSRSMGVGRDLYGVRKDGSEFPIEIGLNPLKTEQGAMVLSTIVDITERKRAEQTMRESEERFQTLANGSPVLLWVNGLEGCEFVNREYLNFLGLESMTDVRGNDWSQFVHPDDREAYLAAYLRACEAQTLFSAEFRFRRHDGQYCWMRSEATPRCGADGTFLGFVGASVNITERKHAEETLRESQSQSLAEAAALARLNDASFRLWHKQSLHEGLDEMLAASIELLGADMGNVQMLEADKGVLVIKAQYGFGQDFLDFFREVSAEDDSACGQALRSGQRVVIEDVEVDARFAPFHAIVRAAGFRAVQSTPLISRDGIWLGMLSTHFRSPHRPNEPDLRRLDMYARQAADFIERCKTDEALRESQTRTAGIIESAMDAIVTVDAGQCIVVFNSAAEQMFGCPAAEAIGQPLDRFIPQRSREAHREHISDFSQTRVTKRAMGALGAIYGLRTDGEEFPIEASISQIEAQGQKLFTVILRDITRRKRDEEQLREHAAMLNQAQEAIMMRDLEGKLQFWNQGAERLYGWQAEEVMGRLFSELLYGGDTSQLNEAQRTIVEKGDWQGEVRQFTKDKRELIVEAHWTLIRDEKDQPKSVLVVNNDITERKKLETQFLRTQRLESLGTLAGGIAHDLNNILAPVLMGVQMLQMRSSDTNEQRWLEVMSGNVKRAGEMIKQILLFSRGVQGEHVPLQPKHIIRETVKIITETFPKSIGIKFSIPEELALILGDATQLHQVLMNLCVNARDAMPQGGRLLIEALNATVDEQITAFSPDAQPGPYVQITISDTGTGIPEALKEKIFDPFFTTKELGKGTGLGLSTVLGIVKSHNGFINVYSEAGQGTKFTVYLPAHTTRKTAPLAAPQADIPAGNNELILVIDDEAAIRELTRTTLETFGYRVLLASDGAEALPLYTQYRGEIQAVLTDMMMPYMDGPATIRALQKFSQQIKVIACSGLDEQERINEMTALGVRHFLSKPYTAERLLKSLAALLRNG